MTKHRLRILLGLAAVLAVLVWLDNASNENLPSNLFSALTGSFLETNEEMQSLSNENASLVERSSNGVGVSNENPLSFLRAGNLRETVERPLFAPNRRPPQKRRIVVKAPAPVIKAKKKRNTYKLLGIIRTQERSIALLAGEKNGLNFRVETGDLIDGWYVKRVKAKQIILEQNHEQVVLSIP